MKRKKIQWGSISPIDGRYKQKSEVLRKYFSEESLMKLRLKVEVEYWIFFRKRVLKKKTKKRWIKRMRDWYRKFDNKSVLKIKTFEGEINHDVKAIEYFLREKMSKNKIPNDEWLHFGLTSEDVNNLAYGMAVKRGRERVILPVLKDILVRLNKIKSKYRSTVMLARTHGQIAVPTTFGKEISVFGARLDKEIRRLEKIKIEGKLNGAVGNFNALYLAFPKNKWVKFSEDFVSRLSFLPCQLTTQILPGDSYVRFFSQMKLINSILIGLCQDMWSYVGSEDVSLIVKKNEVGSSTMPQKVNPIDFENAEGNLGMANALMSFFEQKLSISRLQRDLSDSTVKRNFGVALAYSLLGYKSCLDGLEKISINRIKVNKDLDEHWEVLTEAVQTILRKEGDSEGYEKVKTLTRGKKMNQMEYLKFLDRLEIKGVVKKKLMKLSPRNYIGLASKLAAKK